MFHSVKDVSHHFHLPKNTKHPCRFPILHRIDSFPAPPPQITRSQYQNGLMASRLDSTPQSPESGHSVVHLDHVGPTDLGTDSIPTENGPDETTLLLNEQNSPHTAVNLHSQLDNSI